MTTLDELQASMPQIRACARALPRWKRTVLCRAHQVESALGLMPEAECDMCATPACRATHVHAEVQR